MNTVKCTSCAFVFEASRQIRNLTIIGAEDVVAFPCPKCGGRAVYKGSVSFDEEGAATLLSPLQVDELLALRSLGERAQRGEVTREQFVKEATKIIKEKSIVDKLFTRENLKDFIVFLTLLVAALALVIQYKSYQLQANPPKSNEHETQKVEVTVKLSGDRKLPYPPSKNQPCPCESGKLFKRCHGKK